MFHFLYSLLLLYILAFSSVLTIYLDKNNFKHDYLKEKKIKNLQKINLICKIQKYYIIFQLAKISYIISRHINLKFSSIS